MRMTHLVQKQFIFCILPNLIYKTFNILAFSAVVAIRLTHYHFCVNSDFITGRKFLVFSSHWVLYIEAIFGYFWLLSRNSQKENWMKKMNEVFLSIRWGHVCFHITHKSQKKLLFSVTLFRVWFYNNWYNQINCTENIREVPGTYQWRSAMSVAFIPQFNLFYPGCFPKNCRKCL